jgi:hypothetical protein
MKKTLSIMTVALLMAGSTAFACGGCGCETKKADKEKAECEKSCKGEKTQTACDGSKKGDGKKTAA